MYPRIAKIVRRSSAAFAVLALCAAAVTLEEGSRRATIVDRPLAFPSDFAAGVLYGTVDRPDLAEYRELYAPAAAVAAVRKGKPLPIGTVLTMINYAAKRDAAGKPITDERGRFVKGETKAILVMEKRGDAPAHSASDPGAVNWRFQIFRPGGEIETRANLQDCAACHEKRRSEDFVFTGDRMKGGPPAIR